MQFGVSESIAHWGRYRPTSLAICHGQRDITYSQLNGLIDTICRRIDSLAREHSRLGIATRSKLPYLVSLVATLRTGCSVVLINTGLEEPAIKKNLDEARVDALLYDDSNSHLVDALPSKGRYAVQIDSLIETTASKEYQILRERTPADEWGVLFSSGSTGIPKGIERSHESMITELIGWCLELGLTRRTIFYIGRPIHYTGGLVLALSTLLVGGTLILNDYFDDNSCDEVWSDYQQELERHNISWAFFVPDQLRGFTQRARLLPKPPRRAHSVLVMGAPITGKEKVLAKQYLASNIVESWGNSESLGTITDPEDLDVRPDSIGRPFLTDSMCVVDDNCGKLAPGTLGWLAGSEEAGFTCYCQREEDTNRAKRQELIISDDIGYIDEDGYFYVRARSQESICVGDTRVFLPDIEQKARSVNEVEDCCIVALGEDGHDVALVGLVVCSDPGSTDAKQLCQRINDLLDQDERLKEVSIVTELPRLPSGKVDKVQARASLHTQE